MLKVYKICKVFSTTGKYLKLASGSKFNIDWLKNSWSSEIISMFRLNINIIGSPNKLEEPILLVGNHVSYLDIPVLLNSISDLSFVSKSEVKSWPIIGKAAVKGRTIFVERNSNQSRTNAKDLVAKVLIENKQKIVIFPSGTTSINESSIWRKGAFEIAKNNSVKIQPFRLKYSPIRAAAYIGKDNLLVHMYKLFKLNKVEVILEFHEPVFINDILKDCAYWKNWCEQ